MRSRNPRANSSKSLCGITTALPFVRVQTMSLSFLAALCLVRPQLRELALALARVRVLAQGPVLAPVLPLLACVQASPAVLLAPGRCSAPAVAA